MADLEAIREARRQRILQGSQNRINRVLGKPKLEQNDILNEQQPPTAENTETRREIQVENAGTTLRQRSAHTENTQSGSMEATSRPIRNTVKISPIRKPHSVQNDSKSADESLNTSRSSSDAKMMLKHFEFLRIVLCVMVAYLCRRVLSTGYGVFYFQSVVLPFACMEASFFMFKHKMLHNVMLPHKSSMLLGLLMLCGIKPAILQTYNKLMGYMTAASEDFALFFFAFMMANTFIL
ncbi:uncharacterized protein LOC132721638 [Ruditapes philippinarum]|uniref:uncharacterized protein LOC132721638 n=1 Tax=Ruditapes philippinarum TaxID=129788 RepID=UPI00295B48BD|nr:uncharacterized protein LOC132721638 [Ruditapes philippinarum]